MTTRLLTHLPGSRSPEPLFEYVPGLRDSAQSFSRSSAARHTSRQEENLEVGSDVLRDFHWVRDENSDLVRATRLEGARTNSALRSEDFSDAAWTKNSISVTADDAVAPDGTQTADLISDGDSNANGRMRHTLTVADDSLARAASVFVRKRGSDPGYGFALRSTYFGGTGVFAEIKVAYEDGTVEGTTNSPQNYGVEDYNSDWWRVWIVHANNNSGNTSWRVSIYPADHTDGASSDSITGDGHFWGAQLEGVSGGASSPSSYIATQGSAVSRAADDFADTFPGSPQASTIYGKLNLDHIDALGTIAHIGDETDGMRVKVDASNNLVAELFNGGSTASSSVALGHTYGDTVEFRAVYESDGSTTIHAALNGGSESSGTTDSSQSLPSSFGTQDVQIGAEQDGSNPVNMALMSLLDAPGQNSLATMRSLAART